LKGIKQRGFTLVEVIVVLVLLGLIFSILLVVYIGGIKNSLGLLKRSESLNLEGRLFWRFTRSIFGASRVKLVNGTALYLITTGGNVFRGVVWEAYIYNPQNKTLDYYEFPYPPEKIDEIPPQAVSYRLGKFSNFLIMAVDTGRTYADYSGLPDKIEVKINNNTYMFLIGY